MPVASGQAKEVDAFVILTVGTDCNVGKMTAQLQLTKRVERRRSGPVSLLPGKRGS